MRGRLIILGLAVVFTLVGAATATSSATIKLRVTRCPTSYGIPGGHEPAIPKTVGVSGAARGLVAYSNGFLTALGPAGWHCSGGVGADGNEVLTVLPPYVSQESTVAAAINLYRQWNGVAIYTACPFFPELGRGYGVPCAKIAKRELVNRIGGRTIGFEDPPGVRGTGEPSGGSMPANGVVAYTYQGPHPGKPGSLMVGSATCTLPQSQHAVCTAVLNDILSRWAKLP